MGGHKPKAIRGEHRDWLVERCHSGDFTLRGLVSELAERGLKVDYRSVWSFVHDAGLSFKKNSSGWRTGSSRRCAPARAVVAISKAD
jgi:putative transposase